MGSGGVDGTEIGGRVSRLVVCESQDRIDRRLERRWDETTREIEGGRRPTALISKP